MCYNCGCQKPDDHMGKGKLSQGGGSLVEDDFQKVATDWNMDIQKVKQNTYELLKKEFEDNK